MKGIVQAFVYGGLCSVVGLFLLVLGISELQNSEVTCGSSVMKPGDICKERSKHGAVTERTYEEQQGSNRNTGIFMVIGGPLLSIGGAVWFVSGVRAVRANSRAKAQFAPAGAPSQPGGYPQQPQAQHYNMPPQQGVPPQYPAPPQHNVPQHNVPQQYPPQQGQPGYPQR